MPDPLDEWLEVDATADTAEVEAWRLWEAGAVAIEEQQRPDGSVTLVAGFDSSERLASAVESAAGPVRIGRDDGAWRSTWKQFVRPYDVGERLRVVPAWLPAPPSSGDRLSVVIDPGDAFGLEHATTRACLELLVEHCRPGVSLLDVGSGSGILGVAGALLGADPVVACDLDPVAVDATRANAQRNGVAVDAYVGSVGAPARRFDVVAANLGGAAVVVELAATLLDAVVPGGVLLVGGLLVGYERPARSALHDCCPEARIDAVDAEPWRTFVVHVPR